MITVEIFLCCLSIQETLEWDKGQHLFNKHSLHSSEALYTPLGIKDTAVTEKRGLYPHGAHNPVDIDQKDAGGTGN